MIASRQSPWNSRTELDTLCDQLLHAQSHLPAELQATKQNLTLRALTPTFTIFVMLHAHWYQIFCDLYRFLLPDRRESVCAEALSSTPADYASHCQQQCLGSAQEALDLFENLHDLPEHARINDSFFGVIVYQMAQIVGAGNTHSDGMRPSSRRQLSKALALVKQSSLANDVLQNCVSLHKASVNLAKSISVQAVDLEKIMSNSRVSGDTTPRQTDATAG